MWRLMKSTVRSACSAMVLDRDGSHQCQPVRPEQPAEGGEVGIEVFRADRL